MAWGTLLMLVLTSNSNIELEDLFIYIIILLRLKLEPAQDHEGWRYNIMEKTPACERNTEKANTKRIEVLLYK